MTQIGSVIIDEIYNLMERGFYSTVFQPIVQTATGKTLGFEALLRGPENSPLATPGRLFNENGFLPEKLKIRIDKASINSAVRTSSNLPHDSLIFLNILGNTLFQLSGDIHNFIRLLEELGISPNRIVFEVSETTDKEFADNIGQPLKKLRDQGFMIALDDIGVRSPYLYHLLCIEPEFMKLDKTFVRDIDQDSRKQKLVRCLVDMAEQMGSQIIAEGIETDHEMETVKSIGVHFSQGFFVGYPSAALKWSAKDVFPRKKSVRAVSGLPAGDCGGLYQYEHENG